MIWILLGCLLFWLQMPQLAPFLAFAAIGAYLLPPQRRNWVLAATVASWLLADRFFPVSHWTGYAKALSWRVPYIAAGLAVAAVGFALLRLIWLRLGGWAWIGTLCALLFFSFELGTAWDFFPLVLACFILAKTALFTLQPKGGLWPFPVWSETMNPLQSDSRHLEEKAARTPESKIASAHSGFLLLLQGTVVALVNALMIYGFTGANLFPWLPLGMLPTLARPELRDLALLYQNHASGPWLGLGLLVIFFEAMLKIYAGAAATVGAIRLCGFHIFRDIYRPHEAKRFNEFYFRFYYYYSRYILEFFYYPILYRLRFIGSAGLRISASLFLAIVLGGLAFHFLKTFGLVARADWLTACKNQLGYLPYFSFIGLLCALSSYFQYKHIEFKLPQFVRVLLYFGALFIGHQLFAQRVAALPFSASWEFLERLFS